MPKKPIIIIVIIVLASLGLWLTENRYWNVSNNQNVFQDIPVLNKLSQDNIESIPEAKDSDSVTLKNGDVFDMSITAVKKNINGQWVRALGYNGSIPGPTLTIPQGSEITIRLTNKSDIATTLHSHGVRSANQFDGVPGVTQKAIEPGETFEYQLKFPDAGAYWYHPHIRTDYTVESGLYGNYIVTPSDVAFWSPVNREIPMMIDDIALDRNGILPFSKEVSDHALMGRFGNVMLVNGDSHYQISAQQGEVVRLYLTNAANTRTFNFTLPGAKMKLVGADLGRYAHETFVDEIIIGPGERRIVDVLFEKTGELTMIHKTPERKYALGKIMVSSDTATSSYAREFSVLRDDESVAADMDDLYKTFGSKNPDKKLDLTLDMNGALRGMMGGGSGHMAAGGMGMGGDGDAIEWEDTMNTMNRQSDTRMLTWKMMDAVTGESNKDINDWNFKVGDKVKVRIFNDPRSAHPMQHPIHFHGQRFIILSTNGIKNENPVWQDTALIPKGDTMDILLEISNPGEWVAHCHILEHAESGMMISFKVE